VATGSYHEGRVPDIATGLATDIHQIQSAGYKNPGWLPPGAVLVVGTGNSGSQIADELQRSGRKVFLCVGYSGFPIRRYRGRDIFWWYFNAGLQHLRNIGETAHGFGNTTGCEGGRELDLNELTRRGAQLLGRVRSIDGYTLELAGDLAVSLAKVQRLADDFRMEVDAFIRESRLELAEEAEPIGRETDKGEALDSPSSLDLRLAGVTTVVWATGYRWDFGLLRLPVLDDEGAPLNKGGMSPRPGLYFAGMSALEPYSRSIGLVGPEAERICSAIADRV
jgi:putative flavoprotein involved in K+ transport